MTSFTPAPSVPTGQVTLDWNTEDRLETVSLGDTLGIGGPKTSRILMGHPTVSASMETQVSGSLVANKVIGSFSSVYDVFNTPGITSSQDATGTITGTGTTFVSNMEKGGVVLWENGSVTPIIKYINPTQLKYPFDYIGALPVIQPQRFKIYYNGCYMECPNCVMGAGTVIAPSLVTQNINITRSGPDTGALYIQSEAGQTDPSMAISNSAGVQQIQMFTTDANNSASVYCDNFGSTTGNLGIGNATRPGGPNTETLYVGSEGSMVNMSFVTVDGQLFINAGVFQVDYITKLSGEVRCTAIQTVTPPDNTHAAAQGVPLFGLYKSSLDPAIVYIRTV